MLSEENVDRLAMLGAERLAKELLRLAPRSDEAYTLVQRLLSSPEENLARFRRRLGSLKRGRKFIDWRAAPEFAADLEDVLEELRAVAPEPGKGLELLAEFYRCDSKVFERCDDSSGYIGDVFRHDALELFVEYAQRCDDEAWVADLLFDLFSGDEYGVRTELLVAAARFLTEETRRALAARLWKWWQENPQLAFHLRTGVELLARGLRDPALFERAALAGERQPQPGVWLMIAEVFLEAEEPEEALLRLEHVPATSHFIDKRDLLLYTAYEQLGDEKRMLPVAWRIFERSRSMESLKMVLRAVGEERREAIVEQEVNRILSGEGFSHSDAAFLVETARFRDAEAYLLRHRERLDGTMYYVLLPWAKALEETGYALGAVVLYRALLESILARAQSKYYHHGVRYLKKLDALASQVDDWGAVVPHSEYADELRQLHGRKHSFWSRYEGKR